MRTLETIHDNKKHKAWQDWTDQEWDAYITSRWEWILQNPPIAGPEAVRRTLELRQRRNG